MVKFNKKVRKELKQDEFLAFTEKAYNYVNSHIKLFGGIVAGIVLLVIVYLVGSYFVKSRQESIAKSFVKAQTILLAPLAEEEKDEPKDQLKEDEHKHTPGDKHDHKDDSKIDKSKKTKETKSADKKETQPPKKEPAFKTESEKNSAALTAYQKFINTYGSTHLGIISKLTVAGIYYQLGQYDKAIESYQQFLKASPAPDFKMAACEGLGYSYEAKKDYENSVKSFQKLLEINKELYQEAVNIHVARIYEIQDKVKEALGVYKDLLKNSKTLKNKTFVENKIAILEGLTKKS